jgi:hypothetical protein
MNCKFCHVGDSSSTDFYICDSCESFMCHDCMWTSTRNGKDYCEYCKHNLEWEGRRL